MHMFFLNVYLPYQSHDNFDSYMNHLGKIHALIEEVPTDYCAIVGDYNAVLNTTFEHELSVWCSELDLHISDLDVLGRKSDNYTYMSDAQNTTSWLDHIICSHNMHQHISSLEILEKLPSSDHLPLSIHFNINKDIPKCSTSTSEVNNEKHLILKWHCADDCQIKDYNVCSSKYLKQIHIPIDAMVCKDTSCTEIAHTSAIDFFYHDMCNALYLAGVDSIESRKIAKNTDFVIPGWNDYVKSAHSEARDIMWRNADKPRQGAAAELMRRSRLTFKYVLRQCQLHEDMIRADTMAQSLRNKDNISFWRHVSKMNNVRAPLATNINEATGSSITEMWGKHYSALLNSVKNVSDKPSVISHINNSQTCRP